MSVSRFVPRRAAPFALAVAALLSSAGSAPPAAQDDPVTPARPAASTKHVGAAAAAAAEQELSLPVSGLTAENARQAQDAVKALTDRSFLCQQCGEHATEPGTCCEVEREPVQRIVVASVRAHADEGRLAVRVHGGVWLRLGELRTALEPLGLAVEMRELTLQAPVRLLVDGVSTRERLAEITGALQEAEMFERVTAGLRGAEGNGRAFIVAVPRQDTPPTFDALARLIRSHEGSRLIDLAWSDADWMTTIKA